MARPPETSVLTLADLEAVMEALDEHVGEAVDGIAARLHPLVPNALLNIAVERILAERGAAETVSLLNRLATLIAGGRQPADGAPLPLHRVDA